MLIDTQLLIDIVITMPATIAAIGALINTIKAKNVAEKVSQKQDIHNSLVSGELKEVKESVNGKVDELVKATERAAIAETVVALRPEKPPTGNPEEER